MNKKQNLFFLPFSWMILIAIFFITVFMTGVFVAIYEVVFPLFKNLPLIVKIPSLIVIGSLYFFGYIIAPIRYGIPLMFEFSNRFYYSPKGIRYLVLAAILIIVYIPDSIKQFMTAGEYGFPFLVIGIYGIAIIYYWKKIYLDETQ
ncbi:MAG: hypothetical protein Q4B60_07500 [Erysipelotrichaceae bacterium]|nr:hypothetical protein [Erysipelotrichaceae bacterium]